MGAHSSVRCPGPLPAPAQELPQFGHAPLLANYQATIALSVLIPDISLRIQGDGRSTDFGRFLVKLYVCGMERFAVFEALP